MIWTASRRWRRIHHASIYDHKVRNSSAKCLGSWYGLLVEEEEEESTMLQYMITNSWVRNWWNPTNHKNQSTQKKGEYKEPNHKKTKAPKKGGIQGTKHQVPKPPLVTRSISNNKRGGPPKRTLSLEEPSPTATTTLQNRDCLRTS
jgi:hypothetical protein